MAGGPAIPSFERVAAYPWPNYEAHEEYGMVLLEGGRTEDAYAQLVAARGGLDTGRVHLLLGRAAEGLGKSKEALFSYAACLERWPANREAFDRLWLLTPGAEREPLRKWGIRWGQIRSE